MTETDPSVEASLIQSAQAAIGDRVTGSGWQPDYLHAIQARYMRVQWVKENPKRMMAVIAHYKHDPIAFIEDWCITYDPRRKGLTTMPFLLFQRQRDFIHFLMGCLDDNENGLVEKSRDIGASWLCCAFAVWLWLFRPGASVGFGSMLITKVDKLGDMDSLFEKMRRIVRNLPGWLQPIGFNWRKHSSWAKLINPENGSIIKGEGGDQIGRGGRSLIYFKDESAHYERPENIEAALGDNTNVQIDISSVHGSANVFYRRRMAGKVWHPGAECEPGRTRVFIFDWRDHPGKTQAWYDGRRKKAADEGLLAFFAQEVDRDYAGSIDRVIIPRAHVLAALDAHIKLAHLGDWFAGDRTIGADIADDGGDKNAVTAKEGSVITHCDHRGGDPGNCADWAIPVAEQKRIFDVFYDSIGVGAGFKVRINDMKKMPTWDKRFKIYPWSASDAPLDPLKPIIPTDKESRTNEDHYLNVKSQSWFRTGTKFLKTYNAITHGAVYPINQMISIDSRIEKRTELEMELSQAVHAYASNGKVMVDKKPDGALSPNMADSVIIADNPIRKPKGFFDL